MCDTYYCRTPCKVALLQAASIDMARSYRVSDHLSLMDFFISYNIIWGLACCTFSVTAIIAAENHLSLHMKNRGKLIKSKSRKHKNCQCSTIKSIKHKNLQEQKLQF